MAVVTPQTLGPKVMSLTRRGATAFVQAIAVDIARKLAAATPRRTGRAADSWSVSTEALFIDRGRGYNVPGGEGNPIIRLDNFKLGDDIHISNGVRYIGLLNDGRSTKAPAGFVEATVNQPSVKEALAKAGLAIRFGAD